jgi:hypothetical protein
MGLPATFTTFTPFTTFTKRKADPNDGGSAEPRERGKLYQLTSARGDPLWMLYE